MVSRPACELAEHYADTLPSGPELTVGLRKLLEAKDCFVRAALDREIAEDGGGVGREVEGK